MCNCIDTDLLILNYIPLAKSLARKKSGIAPWVSFEEFLSAAYLGLVEAARRFDPNKGSFPSYARLRILGEMTDYMKEISWGSLTRHPSSIEELDVISSDDELSSVESFDHIISDLNPSGQKIIKLYFWENYSLKEIGNQLGLSEGRISQILKECKQVLNNKWKSELECAA